jgi:hypothetical protein
MDSRQLKAEQIQKLAAVLGRQLRYLNRLCVRMQRLSFPVDDPLSQRAIAARNALQSLYAETLTSGQPSWRDSDS